MELYTTYFARLKYLPKDVVPIAICIWPPRGLDILRLPELCPTEANLKLYKFDDKFSDFAIRYDEETLAPLHPQEVFERIKTLSQGKSAALTCYEKLMCHRFLAKDWFNANGIRCAEWHPVNEGGI